MTKDLRVLLAAHIGYPWGGPSQRYQDLLESSLPHKVQLTFFESSPNKKSFSGTGKFNAENIFGFIFVFIRFVLTLFRVKPDIVHVASAYGFSFIKHSLLIVVAGLTGARVILAPHCSISTFIPRSKLAYRWMHYVLNKCAGLVVLSSEWGRITQLAEKPRIIILKNAIQLTPYLQLERPIKQPHQAVLIVYLGHIGVEKGIDDLIQAVKILETREIKGYEVRIYGEPLRQEDFVREQALVKSDHLDGHISFFDPVFDEQKRNIFQDADIYVLPSHHEGMPVSVIEAMAAGLPVIATRVGGLPDLIENNRNGILVNKMSPAELADALMALIGDANLRVNYGIEGRKKARENHDVERYVDQLIDFYSTIINNQVSIDFLRDEKPAHEN